jgi:uncharacterized repeat protein (TIGR03806 family)
MKRPNPFSPKSRFKSIFQSFAFWGLSSILPVLGADLPAGFAETQVADGLNPTSMTFAPDGRLFLCEKHGCLRVVSDGKMLSKPALDISDRVDSWNERGLLSVCFDPEFSKNGWIYVYYTHHRDPQDTKHLSSNNRVSRFTMKGDTAAPGSELVVLEIDNLSKSGWHNGGGLAFGADGKLYVSTGENANGPNAQDGGNLLGKLLRLNKDGSIPEDNPFYGKFQGKNRAIVALGLRNAYSISVQPKTGVLYLSDVGASFEQIERYDSGKKPEAVNYGWPGIDGPSGKGKPPEGYRPPEYAYDHGKGKGLALCGGGFYSPSSPGADRFPAEFTGRFFFSDYGGWIKMIDPTNPQNRLDFATGIDRPIDVAAAPDGALWYLARAGIPGGSDKANSASENGSLWRVRWTGGGSGPAKLAVLKQPENSSIGMPVGEIRIALQDADGKTITTATDTVTLAIQSNLPAGKLIGKTTVPAVQGVAVFPTVGIDQPGRGYILLASSGKLTTISKAFDVDDRVTPPVIAPGGENFTGPVWARVSGATPGSTIHFTIDGKEPDAASPVYVKPFEITKNTTVKAVAIRKGLRDSTVTRSDFKITGSTPYGIDFLPPVASIKLPATAEEGLPKTLSAIGIFADKNLTPKPGVIPYSLNSSIWADGAEIRRWMILPDAGKIGFSPTGEYTWPGGTVFVQNFEMVTNQATNTRRRIETRLLVLDAAGTFGYGANYRWRPDGVDADLVDAAGAEEVLKITGTDGTVREQTWMYPSSGLCFMCHTPNAGFVLGPKTRQLNGVHTYPSGRTDNQLRTWSYLGVFTKPLAESAISDYPHTCRIDDTNATLEDRARSYLDANCSSCHRPGGTGAGWDARHETPFSSQGILNGPVRNTFGLNEAKILAPGNVEKSMLHRRMAATSMPEQMPPITRNVADSAALKVLEEWIRSQPSETGAAK